MSMIRERQLNLPGEKGTDDESRLRRVRRAAGEPDYIHFFYLATRRQDHLKALRGNGQEGHLVSHFAREPRGTTVSSISKESQAREVTEQAPQGMFALSAAATWRWEQSRDMAGERVTDGVCASLLMMINCLGLRCDIGQADWQQFPSSLTECGECGSAI